ncbi:MAG: hypothetical protein ACI9EF_002771 [Pseudohongiellaceae bacterium]|jgi:hypothetical protein
MPEPPHEDHRLRPATSVALHTATHILLRCCTLAFGLVCVAPLALSHETALHPKDGPDADLRFILGEQSLRAVLVLNLAFIDGVVDVPRESRDAVHPLEYDGMRDTLADFFAEHNSVTIDDILVLPLPVEFEVEDADPQLLPLFPNDGARALTRARLVLDYPVLAPPKRIELTWGAYPFEAEWEASGGSQRMNVAARLAVPGDELLIQFSEAEPGYTWHRSAEAESRFEAVPSSAEPQRPAVHLVSGALLIALLVWIARGGHRRRRSLSWSLPATLVAAWLSWPLAVIPLPFGQDGLPDEAKALAIFAPLHANIYRAFDYTTESDVYDALARSVDGELLATLYDQIYRGLIMAEHGGAVSRVSAVRLIETQLASIGTLPPDNRPGFTVIALWQVDGVVHHWGHSHTRVNEYRAQYTVSLSANGWRIAGSQITEQRRLSGSPLPDPQGPPELAPIPEFETFVLPPGSDL